MKEIKIRISKDNLKELQLLKIELDAMSYDDVIMHLISFFNSRKTKELQ